MESYKTKTLNSGAKLLVVKRPKNKSRIQFNLVYTFGSDVETTQMLEVTHFLEHLFVLLTSTKYPSSKQNGVFFSQKGIKFNASVGTKTTEYEYSLDKTDLDIFTDMLLHGIYDFRVDDEIFENEKTSIVEELNEIINDVNYDIETDTDKIIFKSHTRAVSEKARLVNTKRLQPSDIQNFYLEYYKMPYLCFAIYGNIDINLISKKLQNHNFKQHPLKSIDLTNLNNIFKPYNKINESKIIYCNKKDNISTVKILWRVDLNQYSSDYFSLYCIDHILLDNLDSLLLKRLRTEKGLIYDMKSTFLLDEIQNNLSFYVFETSVDSNKILKVIEEFLDVISSLVDNYVDSSDLEKYITNQKIVIKDREESLDFRGFLNNYAKGLLFNKKVKTINQEDKQHLDISKEDIHRTSRKIFDTNNLYISYYNSKNINSQINRLIDNLSF